MHHRSTPRLAVSSAPASPRPAQAELPPGLADVRALPDAEFMALWDAVIVDQSLRDQLLAQAVFTFTARGKVARARLPLHGVILLTGPAGTGKTSLAKGVAARTAEVLESLGGFRYLEAEPHALAGASLGRSQRATTELFASTVTEYAAQGPTIVLLDEVETLAANRAKVSLEANPIDVHRATDAVLVQLDRLAEAYPQLLFVATSNFEQAIDAAFRSRADLVLQIPLPDERARLAILRDTLEALAVGFPQVAGLARHNNLGEVAAACAGMDGRQLRKLVAVACTIEKTTALDPNRLTLDHLRRAADRCVSANRGMATADPAVGRSV